MGSNPTLSANFCGVPGQDDAAHGAPFTPRSTSPDGANPGTPESSPRSDSTLQGHTPGPWQTNGSHVYGPDPERHLVAQTLSGDGRLVADRDLIAAAPDGLELAEWIAYHWANQDMNHADFRVEAFMRAEKVIAKALPHTPRGVSA